MRSYRFRVEDGRIPLVLVILGALLVMVCSTASTASASAPPLFAQVPEDERVGSEAGRMSGAVAIAVDQDLPGYVYAVDQGNNRVDQFSPWGAFIKAWGWGVRDGNAELEVCATQCRSGIKGTGAGQFSHPEAIAVDKAGDVYVIDAQAHRVQKFDPEGALLSAFGSAGSGPGQFSEVAGAYNDRLAVDPSSSTVFVGNEERIEIFEPSGTFKEEIKMPSGKKVEALTVDSSEDVYVAFEHDRRVRKLEPHGPNATFLEPSFEVEPEESFEPPQPLVLTVDGHGDLYAIVSRNPNFATNETEQQQVAEFDATGKCLDCKSNGEGNKPGFDRVLQTGNFPETQEEGIAVGDACGSANAYVLHDEYVSLTEGLSFFRIFGATPDVGLCPAPVRAPVITSQYAVSVESSVGQLRAVVNPEFWSDTKYRVEYGREPCSLGGCDETALVKLTSQVTNSQLTTPDVVLEGLSPQTTYYYRFVAESGGGGPVYGVDPDGKGPMEASRLEGLEGTFRTFAAAPTNTSCTANEAFRVGAAALLPDCRAFELVSPLDKENGDVVPLLNTPNSLPATLDQAAISGERLAYGTYRAFGNAESGAYTSQYVAARHAGEGWVNHPISPPRGKGIFGTLVQTNAEFEKFSPDLCEGWLESFAEPPLAAEAPAGSVDLYRRPDNECRGSGYEALNIDAPEFGPKESAGGLMFELQGVSEDGDVAVFKANRVLASGGSSGGGGLNQTEQVYGRRAGEEERFLCVLPGEKPFMGSCTAGWAPKPQSYSHEAQLTGAVSSDASHVYWTAAGSGQGVIYLRENWFAEGAEDCGQVGAPCTLEVSNQAEEQTGSDGSEFWGAARDGSKALFSSGLEEGGKEPKLYEYRVSDRSTHLIAGRSLGVMGMSSDASKVYFASREALGGANAEGKQAVVGEANMYLYEAGEPGTYRFVGALASKDLGGPISRDIEFHDARVSSDGQSAVFSSYARLTGYDNTDRSSSEPDAELFVYDASGNGGQGKLVCASCNPSGARPAGQQYLRGAETNGPWTAAWIPVPEDVLYSSRVLSENGRRLFFDSYDSLSPRDKNGKQDVYEWETAGEGTCTEASSSYSPQDGGCVDLISSGQSTIGSEFLDASPSGHDVFFSTLSSLLPQDYGLVDIYDARVDGGLPEPPVASVQCEGEACQAPVTPPATMPLGSLTFSGAGNLLLSIGEGSVKPKAKPLTRAQKLNQALRACGKEHGRKRRTCERTARKRYGSVGNGSTKRFHTTTKARG